MSSTNSTEIPAATAAAVTLAMATPTEATTATTTTTTTATTTATTSTKQAEPSVNAQDQVIPVHAANGQPRDYFRVKKVGNDMPVLFGGSDQPPTVVTDPFSANTVVDLNKFHERFHECTRGVFQSLAASDWNNIVVAGGSVLHCLTPGTGDPSPNSDVDLFIYGLDENQARKKINDLFATLSQTPVISTSGDTISVVKTIHTLTFVCPNSIPLLQIILRLHSDPHQVIQAFDVDCCGLYFDGTHVNATKRAADAINSHCNIAVPERSSWTYSSRLIKYARRGYSIGVPSLRVSDVNLTISRQNIVRRYMLNRDDPLFVNYSSPHAQEKIDLGIIEVFEESGQETPGVSDYWEAKHLRKLLIADRAGRSVFCSETRRTKFLNKVGNGYFGSECGFNWPAIDIQDTGYPEFMQYGNAFQTTAQIAEKISALASEKCYGPAPPRVSCEKSCEKDWGYRYARNDYAANAEGPASFLTTTGEHSVTFGVGGIPTGSKEVGGTLDKWDDGCYLPFHDSKKRDTTSSATSLPDMRSAFAKKLKQ